MDDAKAGKVLLDLEKRKKELSQLRGELVELGVFYTGLAGLLKNKPQELIFPGQGFSTEYMGVGVIDVPADAFSKEYLEKSTKKVRDLMGSIREPERQKKQLL